MTIHGEILDTGGHPRAYIPASVQAADGSWLGIHFRIDTGADATCLPASYLEDLGLSAADRPTGDDLGGVGAPSLQYHPYRTMLALGPVAGDIRFQGEVAIFRNRKDLDEALLGMDVLQAFTLVLDVAGDRVILTDRAVDVPS